jgi:hypothetical protein
VILGASTGNAQRAAQPFARFTSDLPGHWESVVPERAALVFGHPDDYRWEGLLVGGVGLGLFAVFQLNDVRWFPWGAFAGGVVGGLIGGLIPKAPADSTR